MSEKGEICHHKTKAPQTPVKVMGRIRSNSPPPKPASSPPNFLICTVEMAPACHVAALLGYTGIHSHAITCNCMKVLKHLPKAGRHLRTRRLGLGLTLRDVHMASLGVARQLRKPGFVLPPSRLHDIETKKITPSVYRLYTLSRVYRCRLNELLSWYGIPPAIRD